MNELQAAKYEIKHKKKPDDRVFYTGKE